MTDFDKLSNAALHGDLETIRTMVAEGFDLSTTDERGESLLSEVITHIANVYDDTPQKNNYDELSPQRCEIVKLLLDLGADPNQLEEDGDGALTHPALTMDTKLIKVLLEAGAKPNIFTAYSENQTLYDWVDTDYVLYIWDNKFPEEPSADLIADTEGAWLLWLDAMAIKYDKRRPDHLFLLREYGARSWFELHPENK